MELKSKWKVLSSKEQDSWTGRISSQGQILISCHTLKILRPNFGILPQVFSSNRYYNVIWMYNWPIQPTNRQILKLIVLNFRPKHTNTSYFFTSTPCLSVNLKIHSLFHFWQLQSKKHIIVLCLVKKKYAELKSLLILVLHLNWLPHIRVIYFHIHILYFMLFMDCSALTCYNRKKLREI